MHFPRICLAVLLLLVLAVGLFGACSVFRNGNKIKIQTIKVAQSIYMLIGEGGNIGISVGDDGVFMIDDEYEYLTHKIRAAIKRVGGKRIRLVINTHWHKDHTNGNENFSKAGAIIVSHENVRKRLSTEQYLAFFKETVPPLPKSALPIITFSRSLMFHMNGDDIEVFHVPHAHTDGDAIVYFRKSNVIHMGDILFEGMYPFIDLSAGGSIDGMIKAIDRVLPMIDGDTKVISGHGALSDKAGLMEYRAMLVGVRDRIARQVHAGKTLKEVLDSRPTEDFDKAWGHGILKPEMFVDIVYSSLTNGGDKKSVKAR